MRILGVPPFVLFITVFATVIAVAHAVSAGTLF